MKTFKISIKIGALVAAVCALNSCDSLDLAPLDYYGSSSYWTKPEHIIGYMDGLHANLRDKANQHSYLFGEARGGTHISEISVDGSDVSDKPLKKQSLSAQTSGVTKFGELYGLIANINIFLQNTLEATYMSNQEKAYYLGQAYGMRAFHYFDLYRTYGTVPLRLDPNPVANGDFAPENLYMERSSGVAVIAQIKSDLKKSLEYFGDNKLFDPKNRGHKKSYWSKAATECLAAEVYLWNAKVAVDNNPGNIEDLQVAKQHLNSLIQNYGLALEKDYSKVFSVTNKGNSEIILAIRYLDGEAKNPYRSYLYNYGTGQFKTTGFNDENGKLMGDTLKVGTSEIMRQEFKKELFMSYDKADGRRNVTFLSAYSKDKNELVGTVMCKLMGHFNISTNQYVWDADMPIYRFSMVYLMLAEIANMEGDNAGVVKNLNIVRERAYGNNWKETTHGYVAGDFTKNELAILHEKDKEFVCEGQRWWDVNRMTLTKGGKRLVFCQEACYGTEQPILDEVTEAHKVLWPLETEMINKDTKLVQTPGYENPES